MSNPRTDRAVARRLLRLSCSLAFLLVCAADAPAEARPRPEVGQDGKDVIWLPSCRAMVDKMLDLAKVRPEDSVVDLGSGDGCIVIAAAKRGARALGVEYDAGLVALSRRNADKEGVSDRARFVRQDLFKSDLSSAAVITMFLLPAINLRLRPRLLELKPGTRVVSNTFAMGDWHADETATVPEVVDCFSHYRAFLWIVPAKVGGAWSLTQDGLAPRKLSLKQRFQTFSGTLESGSDAAQAVNGRLKGDLLSFSVGVSSYTGRVDGGVMEGTVDAGGSAGRWSAVRLAEEAKAPPKRR